MNFFSICLYLALFKLSDSMIFLLLRLFRGKINTNPLKFDYESALLAFSNLQ